MFDVVTGEIAIGGFYHEYFARRACYLWFRNTGLLHYIRES